MKTGLWTLAALLSLSMTAAADVEVSEEMTFDVNPGARVSLENINGDITITGGAGEQVKVTAHKKAGKLEYLDEEQRLMQVTANGKHYESLLLELRQGMFGFVG